MLQLYSLTIIKAGIGIFRKIRRFLFSYKDPDAFLVKGINEQMTVMILSADGTKTETLRIA